MNDHSVGITEPQRLDCQNTEVRSACAPAPRPSVRPATIGTHSTGTSCRWSRRWNTLRAMRCCRSVVRSTLSSGAVGARPVHELLHRGAVELGDGELAVVVVDAEELVRLGVRAVRRVHRDVEALLDHLAGDRSLEVEAQPHRRRRHQHDVGVVDHEVGLEQLLVRGEGAPVLPHAVDQAVVVEAEEEAVHVGVVAPAERGRGVPVLAEHVRAVGDGLDVVEARGGEVVAVDLPAAERRGRRGAARG